MTYAVDANTQLARATEFNTGKTFNLVCFFFLNFFPKNRIITITLLILGVAIVSVPDPNQPQDGSLSVSHAGKEGSGRYSAHS